MKNLFVIDGMTCQMCVAKVTKSITSAFEVSDVSINLVSGETKINASAQIEAEALQKVLSNIGNYKVQSKSIPGTPNSESFFTTYKPLLIIVGYVTAMAIILTVSSGVFRTMEFMRYFMATFFIVFSLFKLLDVSGFASSYASYDLLAKRWRAYGFIYPFIELFFGLSLLAGFGLGWLLPAIAIVMAISTIGVVQAVLSRREIKCACLGTTIKLPMTTVTIVEDVTMVLMSILMYISL